jgi:RNA polymerase sigma factor (sigma-70 family)
VGPANPTDEVVPVTIEEVYRRDRAHLVRLAAVLTQELDEAEDAVQDAFVGLQRRWPTLSDPARVAGYLRVSVINAARSRHRRRALARRRAVPDFGLAPPADTGTLLREEYRAVVAGVRRLPRRQQQVVALRYWSGLTDAEIAAALGISEGTVRSSASRALGAIARGLEELG